MNWLDIFYAFLSLLGGIGVFLYGMKLMGDSLEMVAGNHFKTVAHQLHSVKKDADTAKQGQKRIKYVKPIHFNFGWTKFARFSPL